MEPESDSDSVGRASEAGQGQTNRILGYPDDARLLIVNADDFGMCHAVNEAVFLGLTEGVVSSTSLMVPCPWAPQAMQFLRAHPEIPFAVHLTLVCDFAIYRWGPSASRDRVRSLVDPSGTFFSHDQRNEMLAQARLEEVEIEFRAQIERVLNEGLHPSHLDWHCLADGGRDDIFALTVALAREYHLALRVHERAHAGDLQRDNLPTVDHGVLDSYHMTPEEKPTRYPQLLRELPAGLSEWAVHPSLGDAEAQALEPENWRIRRADLDFVTSSVARDILTEEGIIVLDYHALREVWSH